jgi:hypothetical protein
VQGLKKVCIDITSTPIAAEDDLRLISVVVKRFSSNVKLKTGITFGDSAQGRPYNESPAILRMASGFFVSDCRSAIKFATTF